MRRLDDALRLAHIGVMGDTPSRHRAGHIEVFNKIVHFLSPGTRLFPVARVAGEVGAHPIFLCELGYHIIL